MKRLLQLLLLIAAAAPVFAADTPPKGTPYTATVTGMVCNACRTHVTDALKKLPGVTQVEITRGEQENTQKVTFASQVDNLTKQDAINALGQSASQYQVLSLEKSK
ncbi:MAG: heavy-metal-associated domain-containing protein [Verrucomicrobium sp.]